MGAGIVAMHFIALQAWHIEGRLEWNVYGMIVTLAFGLGLGALAVNRANRPVTGAGAATARRSSSPS